MSTALRLVLPDDPGEIGGDTLSPQMTLSAFYREWYAPMMEGRLRRPATVAQEAESLQLLARYTGDPPVCEITPVVASSFVAELARRQTPRGRVSVNTVRKHLRTLQPILDRLGPPGPRMRVAAGLLSIPPALPSPRPARSPTFRAFSADDLRLILRAADHAPPCRATCLVPPPKWWRSCIILARTTAMRIGSLLSLQWRHFDSDRWAVLPREATKTGQPLLVYFNAEARRALDALRPFADDCVLPWRAKVHSLHNARRILWNRVLPPNRRWGFHAIRRATLTWAAAINPMIARMIAGHSTGDVLRDHYVDPRSIAGVLDQLPPLEPD